MIALVDRPGWDRYHALLRDHLLAEVERADADALRRQALSWSREHGLYEDAAEYARAAGDVGALLELIEDHTLDLVRTGRSRTLVRWTTAIPRTELIASPRALIAGIGAAHVSGRPAAEIRRLLVLARATVIAGERAQAAADARAAIEHPDAARRPYRHSAAAATLAIIDYRRPRPRRVYRRRCRCSPPRRPSPCAWDSRSAVTR